MIIELGQLAMHLRRAADPGGTRLFTVCSDDPLALMQATDAIRKFSQPWQCQRQIFTADRQQSPEAWLNIFATPSMFGDCHLVEIRIPSGKPNKDTASALIKLTEWLQKPISNDIALILLPYMNKTAQKAKWFDALAQHGLVITASPPTAAQWPSWIKQRLAEKNLQLQPDALQWLALHTEGNTLAAHQEIEKLSLLFPADNTTICLDDLQRSVGNVARYNAFELSPALLSGDIDRAVRILSGLRAEGEAPQLIFWVLLEDLHALATAKHEISAQTTLAEWMRQHRIWGERQKHFAAALKNHTAESLELALVIAIAAEHKLKGAERGDPWLGLLELIVKLTPKKPQLRNKASTF